MKKMRKLIPAFAMLMVAAIMMTTASFAWFTMNETVTATGVQIQAKSDGSLIIDTNPLTWESVGTSVDISKAYADFQKVQKLSPVTLDKASGAWQVPTAAAGSNKPVINPSTGKVESGDMGAAAVGNTGGDYYREAAFYVASAGDALKNQDITISLAALSAPLTEAVNAYAIAIYVVEQNANGEWDTVTPTQKPAEIVYVDAMNKRNTVTLTNGTAGYTDRKSVV